MKRILLLLVLAAAACSQPKAPVIGISCSRSSSGATLLASTYTEAISRAGGVAVVLPTVSSAEQADALLAVLDGVVFSGGEEQWLSLFEYYVSLCK